MKGVRGEGGKEIYEAGQQGEEGDGSEGSGPNSVGLHYYRKRIFL
jgi:hypothetical protein